VSYAVEGGWWNPRLALRSSFTHEGYLDAVARVREYILAGDIFQANLSQRFEAPLAESPWALYRRLRAANAAPFAAYLDFPGVAVLSASPERFLRADEGGHVETRPIKGTRPRGVGPEHDAALENALPAIRQGEIVVVWRVGYAASSTDVLAYVKDTPTAGGNVLLRNGTVKEVTAAEFRTAKRL
jgi:hypothetical protein